jgi:hypothetical protein
MRLALLSFVAVDGTDVLVPTQGFNVFASVTTAGLFSHLLWSVCSLRRHRAR